MGLETQTPPWIGHAEADGPPQVVGLQEIVHGLHKPVLERPGGHRIEVETSLWHHHLEFIALCLNDGVARFRADTDPVEPGRRLNRAIGLYPDFKAETVKRLDQGCVELQQRLSTRHDHVFVVCNPGRPPLVDVASQSVGTGKLAPAVALGSDKVGIAKRATGLRAVFFTPRPQIAPGEPAKYGGPSGLGTLALQGIKAGVDGVHGRSEG